jgi:hypothetical protein
LQQIRFNNVIENLKRKINMANKYFRVIFLVAFLLVTDIALCQGGLPPPPPGLPIDGGILGLFALGVGYAIKKIHDKSKR